MKHLLLLFAVMTALPLSAHAQSLRVFIDCSWQCDTEYVKEELPILDFLNERTQADVHVLYTQQWTASGGLQVTLTLIGQRSFAAMSDTLMYATSGDASDDDQRKALVHNLALGLSRYIVRAGLGDKMLVSAIKPTAGEAPSESVEVDPWDYWVFSVGGGGWMNGQATTKFINRRANVSGNRTTEALKVRLSGFIRDTISEFDTGEEIIRNTTNAGGLNGSLIKSIGGHWAVGGGVSASRSSFQNTKFEIEFGPGVEYDVFPYSESTRQLLTVEYGVKLSERNYEELTIFALDRETLLRHKLSLTLTLARKWGSVQVQSTASHLLTNFDRSMTDLYNMQFWVRANLKLVRGLSFNINGTYDRIRDQIDLPAGAATVDEILLQSIQLPTGYSYWLNLGFSYRFGSIYNNVVNPRLDSINQ